MADVEYHGSVTIVPRAASPYRLDTSLAPVDWKQTRERFDPQGDRVAAKELVDQTFTIVDFRPVESTLSAKTDHFYYCKCINPDGVLFNTILGGQGVVEVLDSFDALRAAYIEAEALNDQERMHELKSVGAMAPITVTLRYKRGGKYSGYYYLD